jgi:hypothetical protein
MSLGERVKTSDTIWQWLPAIGRSPARRIGFALWTGFLLVGLLGPGVQASPPDAARSAVQSAIQSARDDVQRRIRRYGKARIGYCMRRFRSYDSYSMTYRGYDGRRHRCS